MIWLAKALTQACLARIPFGEQINHRLQILNGMRTDAYLKPRVGWGVSFWERIDGRASVEGADVVEVGTGWDAIHTILLYALGARKIWTYDHVPHLRFEFAQRVVAEARRQGPQLAAAGRQDAAKVDARLAVLEQTRDLQSFLAAMNTVYVAPGDASVTGLPDHSVDVVYSYAVLAHPPTAVVESLAEEARRTLRPGGLAIHRIGLDDPFNLWKHGDEVDFLRFSEATWGVLGDNSIQSNNRLRGVEHLAMYESRGADLIWVNKVVKPRHLERVRTMKVAKRFAHLPPEELAVTEMDMIARF
jgi:SAM-dependent methyltransferase